MNPESPTKPGRRRRPVEEPTSYISVQATAPQPEPEEHRYVVIETGDNGPGDPLAREILAVPSEWVLAEKHAEFRRYELEMLGPLWDAWRAERDAAVGKFGWEDHTQWCKKNPPPKSATFIEWLLEQGAETADFEVFES